MGDRERSSSEWSRQMKRWISHVIGGDRTSSLWTPWRIALMVVAGAALVAVVASAACNGTTQQARPPSSTSVSPPQASAPATAPPDKASQEIAVKYAKAKAVIVTNKGTITFEFFPTEAPLTVENFVKLADRKFYDGLIWHRYVPGFVIQGGDPNTRQKDESTWGLGGPGYNIPAEFNAHKHVTGAVAMARANDPNSAGSQFYIALAPLPELDGKYTVFGQVVSGMDVVQKLRKGDVMKTIRIEGVAK
jgi:peptidyl-prolyl cis-trans isomerase B (cyclophilin B)